MTRTRTFLLGMGAMYLFDPYAGRRRRAMLRDKLRSLSARADDALGKVVRDLSHRAIGTVAQAGAFLRPRGAPVSDEVLEARVRSSIGRYVSHARAVKVKACEGHVLLEGTIPADERRLVVSKVQRVSGVLRVDDRLRDDGNTPPQGNGQSEQPEIAQENWSPGVRFIADAAGGALVLNALIKRSLLSRLAGGVGIALLLRGTLNLSARRIVGIGAGPRAIDISKTINIEAPIEDVYALWSRFESFPRFMARVQDVRNLGGGRSHWVVSGPAGIPVEFNAILTEQVPNQVIAWKTEPDAAVQHEGTVRFERNPDASTRVDVRMSYNPVAGAIGHALATLFGSDPKSAMDEDLVRLKSLLERGMASAPGKRIRREQVLY